MSDEKIEIEDIRRLVVAPGDRVIIRIDGYPTQEMLRCLKEQWEQFAPDVKVIFMPRLWSVDIITGRAA